MPKFVIERELPGAEKMNRDELKALAQKSNGIIKDLGPEIQWVQSYVSKDKVYCVYNAPSKDLVEEHAKCGGFPANRISKVATVIDPVTAEG